MTFGVVVAVYGNLSYWRPLARRALASAEAQTLAPVQIEYVEGSSLHEARNAGLDRLRTEFAVHLDADDELEQGYLAAMATGVTDVRVPAVRYIQNGRPRSPAILNVSGHSHACTAACLTAGNWIVVGAAVRTELARVVGGWRDFDWSEDWDLWLRCHLAGATFESLPSAVYRAHVRTNSRNRAPSRAAKLAAHRAIEAANGVT